jgi:4-hydroxy-3-polyprenylbenzoate decarboxylase
VPRPFNNIKLALPGIVVVDGQSFTSYEEESKILGDWCEAAKGCDWNGVQLIVLADDAGFTAENENNFVWVTFTRSNPAYDIYGIDSFTSHKHWGCHGPVIIDARSKPHHAPDLIKDPAVERRVDELGAKGGSLHGII